MGSLILLVTMVMVVVEDTPTIAPGHLQPPTSVLRAATRDQIKDPEIRIPDVAGL